MTCEEIRAWALCHGFVADGAARLKARYRDGGVSLAFTGRRLRVRFEMGIGFVPIGSFNPARATLDHHGMIRGIGLSRTFLRRFVGEGDPKPVWMPDAWYLPHQRALTEPVVVRP